MSTRWSLFLALVAACMPPTTTVGTGTGGSSSRYLTKEELVAIPNVFPTTLVPPDDAFYQPMYERMQEWQNPEGIGKLVSQLMRLGDRRIPLVVKQCGAPDAQYETAKDTITICYEFVAMANELLGKPKARRGELDQQAAAVLVFVTLHEMGHALVDVLGLRVTGNEEDLADQFAFLHMTNVNDAALVNKIVSAPAAFFHHHGIEVAAKGGHSPDDVHSSSAQRALNAVCILYARHGDPELGRALGNQAASCVTETARAIDTWNELLRPYTRIDTGQTFEPPATR